MAFMGSAMMAVLVLSGLLHSVAAMTYTVGGSGGWTYQTQNSVVYDDQFKGISVKVGDILMFPFMVGVHNVYEVSQTDLKNCDGSNPIAKYTATNSTVTITSAGLHGYLCEIPTHCAESGMHLNISVLAGTSPAPAPAPKTPAPAPAPKAPAPAPKTPAPAPAPKAPAPAPKAPAPTPKASTPTPTTSAPAPSSTTTPTGSAPTEGPAGPSPPGSSGNVLLSTPAMVVASVLAGCALLLL